MLHRKAERELMNWKNSSSGKALLIPGAHRVDKTEDAEQLARKYFDVFIQIDFARSHRAAAAFRQPFNTMQILRKIECLTGTEIRHGSTQLFSS